MPELTICICTFRRPELLEQLLAVLLVQLPVADAKAGAGNRSVEVIVVDNDPHGSAGAVLNAARIRWGGRLTSLHVSTPNISLARNKAVHAASGEWLAMIDDDEIPLPGWIEHLTEAQRCYQADVVFGPVLVHYAPEVSTWLQRGGYFERRRLVTGTAVGSRDARTSNVLVRRSALLAMCPSEKADGPFDESYGRTGGEDSILFRELARRGATMVWCDEAPVSELVPMDRANPRWLLARSFRTGQLYLRTELHTLRGGAMLKRLIFLSVRGLAQGGLALLLSLLCLPVSRRRSFFWLRVASSQAGKLSVWWGGVVNAYGTTP